MFHDVVTKKYLAPATSRLLDHIERDSFPSFVCQREIAPHREPRNCLRTFTSHFSYPVRGPPLRSSDAFPLLLDKNGPLLITSADTITIGSQITRFPCWLLPSLSLCSRSACNLWLFPLRRAPKMDAGKASPPLEDLSKKPVRASPRGASSASADTPRRSILVHSRSAEQTADPSIRQGDAAGWNKNYVMSCFVIVPMLLLIAGTVLFATMAAVIWKVSGIVSYGARWLSSSTSWGQ